MNGLDLFSGIGGLTLALAPWVRPVAYCESDRYCTGVLLSRMQGGDLPQAPVWDDVRTLRREHLDLPVDVVYGGFPCQDISVAGRGRGLDGERSGLVFELLRLVEECRPTFVFLENVPAIRTRGGERVVKELARLGFDCRWTVVSAAQIGAPHLRKRWFLLAAHPERLKLRDKQRRSSGTAREGQAFPTDDGKDRALAYAVRERLQVSSQSDGEAAARSEIQQRYDVNRLRYPLSQTELERISIGLPRFERQEGWWSVEPGVGRVAHGVPARPYRLRALGNAVVPQQAREAFMKLVGLKEVA